MYYHYILTIIYIPLGLTSVLRVSHTIGATTNCHAKTYSFTVRAETRVQALRDIGWAIAGLWIYGSMTSHNREVFKDPRKI
jgi:hypothetical protein